MFCNRSNCFGGFNFGLSAVGELCGQLAGDRPEPNVPALRLQRAWLDYLGVAVAPEAALPVMEAWIEGQAGWASVRAAIGGGAR